MTYFLHKLVLKVAFYEMFQVSVLLEFMVCVNNSHGGCAFYVLYFGHATHYHESIMYIHSYDT